MLNYLAQHEKHAKKYQEVRSTALISKLIQDNPIHKNLVNILISSRSQNILPLSRVTKTEPIPTKVQVNFKFKQLRTTKYIKLNQ